MTEPTPRADINLVDLKARKGHICQGGLWGDGTNPVCGCGARLREQPDFMDLPPAQQRSLSTTELSTVESAYPDQGKHVPDNQPNDEPPLVSGDDVPPAPFTHASGEPCYGCQSCFAEVADDGALGDPMAEADAVESAGRDVIMRHGAPDMNPSVPVIDPTQPYGPAEVERAMLDANARLERGLKHEANLIAAAEELKIEYELAYARAIDASRAGAADQRKANAIIATERQYRAWREAVGALTAMKSITHTLRSTVSALQSVSRSVGVSYTGPQGRGR